MTLNLKDELYINAWAGRNDMVLTSLHHQHSCSAMPTEPHRHQIQRLPHYFQDVRKTSRASHLSFNILSLGETIV